jgi:hypothetical protein
MNSDKAPWWLFYGFLPGLLGCFKRKCYEYFSDFHARCKFKKNLNATFVVLIPKILGVLSLRIFAQFF